MSINKQANKGLVSKAASLSFPISFVMIFMAIFMLSIWSIILEELIEVPQNEIECILLWLSKFDSMKDPISIFIEILTSIGGVFFGIRIGQWIDNREKKEEVLELWRKINSFLTYLNEGIADKDISIYELAEYKIHWDSLQHASAFATKIIQEDNRYIDISYAFSFLAYYNHKWINYDNIENWRTNTSTSEARRIQDWIKLLDDLILYTQEKVYIA